MEHSGEWIVLEEGGSMTRAPSSAGYPESIDPDWDTLGAYYIFNVLGVLK